MNTISPIRPYMNKKNSPQIPTTQPQSPNFKGLLGKKVMKELTTNKKTLAVASVLTMISGLFGLSKEKASDVLEELMENIRSLMDKNDSLGRDLEAANKEIEKLSGEKERAHQESELRLNEADRIIRAKNAEISEQRARITELEKYAAMANVTSVDKLDILKPEEFLALLEEAREAQPKAEASLLNYLFNGTGQEEFLAQMERSNRILKAKKAGITKIPEIKNASEKIKISIGYDPVHVAQEIMRRALENSEQGQQINYPPIRRQIWINAEAIIKPMMEPGYQYPSNDAVLEEVSQFHTLLAKEKAKIEQNGWVLEKRSVNSNNIPYYTFKNQNGDMCDIYVSDLAYGNLGYARKTLADGTVVDHTGPGYWE